MGSTPKFFAFVVLLSVPFYLASGLTGIQLLPGLPVSALEAFCPMVAAIILTRGEGGASSVASLLKRSFDFRRIQSKVWYVPAVLLMPAVMTLSFAVTRFAGVPIPTPSIDVLSALVLLVAFLVAALGEELGWSGYAIDGMQAKQGALSAAVTLGIFWALWHVVPLMQANRSLTWVAWWSLGTVALRVIIVWLYNNSGRSVFAATLFHTTINLTWQLFPINGSYYNPVITSLILVGVAALVVTIWGARTLVDPIRPWSRTRPG